MNELPNTLSLLLVVLAVPFLRPAFFYRPPWQTEARKTRSRIQFFDVLRGVAIVAVIGIHAVDFYRLELFTETTGLLFINALLRFAIPLFLIASGMLLDPHDLRNGQSRESFYWRKLIRIFVPYATLTVLWSVMQPGFSLSSLFLHLIRGDILVPYYFIIVLFELYALYPLLVRLAVHKWFLYVSLAISICAATLRFRYIGGVPLPFEYIFFFAYGIALRPLMVAPQKYKTISILPWLGIAACYFAGFLMAPDYYYNAVYFWGLAVFWIIYLEQRHVPEVFKVGLAYIGRLSLWIFLLHYPILFWIGERTIPVLRSLPVGIAMVLLIGSTLAVTVLLAAGIAWGIKRSREVLRFS